MGYIINLSSHLGSSNQSKGILYWSLHNKKTLWYLATLVRCTWPLKTTRAFTKACVYCYVHLPTYYQKLCALRLLFNYNVESHNTKMKRQNWKSRWCGKLCLCSLFNGRNVFYWENNVKIQSWVTMLLCKNSVLFFQGCAEIIKLIRSWWC